MSSLKSMKRDLRKLERTYKRNAQLKKINKKLKKEVQKLSRPGKPIPAAADAGKFSAAMNAARTALTEETKKIQRVNRINTIRRKAVHINREYHITRNAALLAGFAAFLITPGQARKKDRAKYFGPYTSGGRHRTGRSAFQRRQGRGVP